MNSTTYTDGTKDFFVTSQREGETDAQLHLRMTAEAMSKANGREVASITNKRMGRNSRCMCGSGKKFKRCCGRTSVLD